MSYGQTNKSSLPIYDDFDYTVGDKLIPAGDTNLDGLDGWSIFATNAGTSNPVIIDQPSWRTDTGLPTFTGEAIQIQGGTYDPQLLFTASESTGVIYSSFIFKINPVADQHVDFVQTTDYFYSFGRLASNGTSLNYTSAIYLRKVGTGAVGSYNIGISENNNSSVAVWAPGTYTFGDEIVIVISYDFNTYNSALWINPVISGVTEPAPTVFTNETTTSNRSDLDRVRINKNGNAQTPNMIIDEIRVGKSWASVVTNPTTASVKDQEFSNYFSLYPNPSSGLINIQSKNVEVKKVEIYNLTGQRVLEQQGLVKNGVNVSGLSKGIYILKLSSADNQFSRKIVVE